MQLVAGRRLRTSCRSSYPSWSPDRRTGRAVLAGSWPYGEGSSLGWVDGFHTAYNLVALQSWMRSSGSSEFVTQLERGLAFYRSALIDRDGAPRATVRRRYPVETHAVGSALWVLS